MRPVLRRASFFQNGWLHQNLSHHFSTKPLLIDDVVNFKRYPTLKEDDGFVSAEGTHMVDLLQREIRENGFVLLPSFLKQGAVAEVMAEMEFMKGEGFDSRQEFNIFLEDREGHPSTHRGSKTIYDASLIPSNSVLRLVYNWPTMVELIKLCFGLKALYPSADEFGCIYLNVFKEGDSLGWHFDRSDFSVNLMLSPSMGGGDFEYVPRSRRHFEVQSDTTPSGVEANMPCEVLRPAMKSGDLVLFSGGRQSLHRVTPVTRGERCNVIFTFVERDGDKLNDYTLQKFFGRRRGLV